MKKRISYANLVKNYCGDMVLSNEIFSLMFDHCDVMDVLNGSFYTYYNQFGNQISEWQYNECANYGLEGDMQEREFYQFYHIDKSTADTLCALTDETIVRFPWEDAYFWCVDHWGTPWAGVYTTIEDE